MNSIVEVWEQLSKEYGSRLALKDESAGYCLSFTELYETINKTSQIIENLNLKKNCNILLCLNPHPLWHVIDQAIMTSNCVSVLADPTSGISEIKHLIETMNIKALFTDNTKVVSELEKEKISVHIFYTGTSDISAYKNNKHIHNLQEEISSVKYELKQNKEYFSDDLASIMFSSGTSGKTKGVMFSRQSLLSTFLGYQKVVFPVYKKTCVSVLSCSHAAPRLTELAMLSNGNTIIYTNYTKYFKTVKKYKPYYLLCVPKILNAIIGEYKKECLKTSKIFQIFNNIAFNISLKYYEQKFKYSKSIIIKAITKMLSICNVICYTCFIKNIIEKFMNPTTYVIAFGAVAGKITENTLSAMGLNLLVHYGMTEASVISYSSKEHKKAYSVGKLNPYMDVIISDVETGEKLGFNQKGMIKVKGKQVMKGYYNNEEETKKVFDSEGYLITGDLGYISEDGFLYFVGRHKNIIVLNNGENIDSVKIEQICTASNFVQQIVVFGQDKPYLTAAVVLDKDYVKKWAKNKNIDITDKKVNDLLKKDIIIDINNLIGENKFFRWIEQIKDIVFIDEPFTIENGLMTRKYTIIRTKVYDKYHNLIDNMYK